MVQLAGGAKYEPPVENESTLKRYLLGLVTEDERTKIELAIIGSTDDFFILLDRIEDDLLVEFLNGELSAGELDAFHSNFIFNQIRTDKLNFFRALLKIGRRDIGRTD
jgi:hypothetical protein